MMYSEFNNKHLETYGFAEADLLSLKTKLKTYRRSSLRGKLNVLSKKPFEKWPRQSPIRVNLCNLCLIKIRVFMSSWLFHSVSVRVRKVSVIPCLLCKTNPISKTPNRT